jgi:group I intron endonuclease
MNNDIIPLNNKKIINKEERYVEIYKIFCLSNKKLYVGQTVSHILNNGKYRRHGMEKRFKEHISESFSSKKNQCHYLNNAIRKYGPENFKVEIIEICKIENSDERETYYIKKLNTMFPSGFNLKYGSKTIQLSDEGKKRVSDGVHRYYIDKKYERFKNIIIPEDVDISTFIKPLRRNNIQYGWYVLINRKKADFGGIHISLDTSKQRVEEFINNLKNQYIAKHLDAGNSV